MNTTAFPPPSTGEGRDGGDDADDGGRPATTRLIADCEDVLNLDWITSKLAVGGAFDDGAIGRLATLGIRAVIDLRSEAWDDRSQLDSHGVSLLHLPTEDHCAVSQPMLVEGVAFALNRLQRGERVLIHCREGIGRSVTLALCVLCALGREPLVAMDEIKDRRACASPSPAQFEAWAAWLRGRGTTPPHFDDFAAIAYRHLEAGLMLVYGDHARTHDPQRLIAQLGDALANVSAMPAGIERHAVLVSAFVKASELAQGLADAAFETLGDGRSIEQDAAMAALMSLARALIASPDLDLLRSRDSLDESRRALMGLAALELTPLVATRRGEGYAYYALYPEAYAAAAAPIAPAHDMMVIGLRSIGTGLAAMVAAALDAPAPITLRPVGPPFRRELRLSAALGAEMAAHRGRFALVDEGPGLSGSSLGCVSDLLEDFGVPPGRIVIFPGHDGELGAQASARHRRRWAEAQLRVVGFDALIPPERLASWADDLIGAPVAPIQDLSGGAWRALSAADPAKWPPANTLQERRKFKITTAVGDWLMKFVGLGATGEDAYRRARRLGEAGLSPKTVGLRHGFLVQRWVGGGRMFPAASGHDFVPHVGAYLSFRARRLPADEGAGASLEALLEMARTNTAEALGDRHADALEVWRSRLAALVPHVHPVETDNRLHPWEWVQGDDGRWLKTDAVDHAHAHDLIGPQDIAWDVAGATVEFGLALDEGAALRAAVQAGCGRSISAELVGFYRPAYLAFQLGAYAMAADAHAHWPDEKGRLAARRDRYADALDRLLARGRPSLGEGQA